MKNTLFDNMVENYLRQKLTHFAQTNNNSFTNNNDNIAAIKDDFKKKYPDINFDTYYSQSQTDTQEIIDNQIIQYNNAEGYLFAMLTNKKEKNLYIRIIEFYTFFLRQFDNIQDDKKEMDKYRTYPPLFTYTITTKLRTPSSSAGEGIESIDYFESAARDAFNTFTPLKEKTLNGNTYIIIKEKDYTKAFITAFSLWKTLK